MTRTRKAFAAFAMAALIAPAAAVAVLSAPAAADGNGRHRHDLDTYKREGWIELTAGAPETHTHMYCDTGDYALDGMWKVDAHDGDDRTVRANVSYADPAEVDEWHFRLVNSGPGRAQVKLFVTCLDNDTGERDGHAHTLALQSTTPVLTNVVLGAFATTQTCAAGEIPVAPGFGFTAGSAGRPYRSYPTASELGWGWSFVGTTAGSVTTYLKCLAATTSSAGTPAHTHLVDADLVPGYGGQSELLPAGEQIDRTISSRAHDEGNVGAYWIDDPFAVHYLGQDARGQVRTVRFWNTGTGSGQTYLAIWGFDKRTTRYPVS